MPEPKLTRRSRLAASVALGSLFAASHAVATGPMSTHPSLKVVTVRYVSSTIPPWQTTEYIQADRKRLEYRNDSWSGGQLPGSTTHGGGKRIAEIRRCDLGKHFTLDLDRREYESVRLPKVPTDEAWPAVTGRVERGKPTLLIETTTVDTGERKQIFGHTARRVITTRSQVPLDGGRSEPQETRSDGWYIDVDTQIACERWGLAQGAAHTYLTIRQVGEPAEVPTFKDIGTPETGYPIEVQWTARAKLTSPAGGPQDHTSAWSMRVTELSVEPHDPALFEVPAGFRDVTPLSTRVLGVWQRLRAWISGLR